MILPCNPLLKIFDLRRAGLPAYAWALLFLLAATSPQLAVAQSVGLSGTGLTGTVTDPSGAAVSGAHISFRNEATGVVAQFATASDGVYSAPLGAGGYEITVEAIGFQNYQASHVAVEIGAMSTFNISLRVGTSNETVHVTSEGALELNTTNPQLDTMLPTAEVTDLPLEINGNMRQITSFASLAPGVRTPSNEYGTVTVEGGAENQINSSGNYYNGLQIVTASNINSDPPYEMVDQFRIIRNLFSARYGMVQGAVDYNMRTGTNQLHGDGFFIDRNSAFDSQGFFPGTFNSAGQPVPPVDRETDWGGTIGGPVVIPHFYNGHNKTFFLGSFDIYNKNQGLSSYGTVPTVAEKQGDFSNFVNTNDQVIPIYDPQTGQQFDGCNTGPTVDPTQLNKICPTRIDPLSKTLLQYIPDPDSPGTDYGMDSNKSSAVKSVPYQTQAFGVTINHQLSPSQNLNFTWWRNHYYVIQEESVTNGSFNTSTAIVGPSNPLSPEQWGVDNANIWLGNYSKTFTPNLVMTAGVAAQNKMQNYQNTSNPSFAGVVDGSPYISFNGQNAPTSFGNGNGEHVQNYVDNIGWNLFDNVMWTKGRHTFNIGGEFHHYWEYSLSNYSLGHFAFSQAETSIPNTTNPNFSVYGSSFASFLLGLPDSASRTSITRVALHTNALAGYFQDDIKLTTKLTVNAGLRYDVMMPYVLTQNNNVFLNGSSPSSGAVNPATGNGLPGWATEYGNCSACAGFNQIGIHHLNFGPRIGFAYSLDKNTVIQGGYTITYLGFGGAYGQGEGLSGGPNNMAGLLGGSFTVNGTGGYVSGYGPWTNPTTGAVNPIPTVNPTPFSQSLGLGQTIYYLDDQRNGEAPMLQMWTLSVQRQIPWHTVLTVDYLADRTTHLSGYNINPMEQPNPSVLSYGSCLTDKITANLAGTPCAGITAPYANFVSNFGGGATVYQALKPFPQYSAVSRAWDQAATAYFSAWQIQADKHMSNNLNFLANIELPRLYDNMATVVNEYNPQQMWAEDTTGSFESKFAGTYELPFGAGQRWLNSGRLMNNVVGGWQAAAILTYNNSQPLSITQSGESLMNGTNVPNINPNVPMWSGGYGNITKFFDHKIASAPYLFSTNAWTNTGSQYVLGNAQRGYTKVRGPWYPVEDLSAKKVFRITEGRTFALRMDYFNALNRVQAPFPTTSLGSTNFGQVTSKFTATNREGQIEGTFNF
jgi:Carboxypeptidase regulatory-like domain